MEQISSLIHLQLRNDTSYENSNFKEISKNTEVQKKFNNLKNGYYLLIFNTRSDNNHAIAYIKKKFGSYILDSNFGLIKCDHNPVNTINKLLDWYTPLSEKGSFEHHLKAFSYKNLTS